MAGNNPRQAAVVGLGLTKMTRRYSKPVTSLASEAVQLALEDAGLKLTDLDGLLTHGGVGPEGWPDASSGGGLHNMMGMKNLRLYSQWINRGSAAGQNLVLSAHAVQSGMADVVCYVFADAPLTPASSSGGAAYGGLRSLSGLRGLPGGYGFFGANTSYALAARRHMALYGTTQDHLGAVAVSNRKWAGMNPDAIFRDPMTLDDYHNSRWVVEPFHLFDCCMVNNGAIAFITTTAERAKDLKQPPAYILGMGEGYPGNPKRKGYENEVHTGAAIAKDTAFPMAGITVDDIDVVQTYDNYTYTCIVTLEDYGFCGKGEGGPFVADGKLEPGGSLPTNTSGGELSAHYLWGATPLSEGVLQARGTAGERQVAKHDVVVAASQGGTLDFHYCMVMSPHQSLH